MRRTILAVCLLLLPSLHATAAAAAGAGAIEPFHRGSYAALLKANAGRPLIVHFWSITCAPCLAEMPRWARLKERHPDLALVLVSTDPVAEAPRVAAVMGRYGASKLPAMAFADPFSERLFFEVDRGWRGELPRSQLVGSDGSATPVTGAIEEPFLQRWLESQGVEDGTRSNPAGR